jgi:hypothetical protein
MLGSVRRGRGVALASLCVVLALPATGLAFHEARSTGHDTSASAIASANDMGGVAADQPSGCGAALGRRTGILSVQAAPNDGTTWASALLVAFRDPERKPGLDPFGSLSSATSRAPPFAVGH